MSGSEYRPAGGSGVKDAGACGSARADLNCAAGKIIEGRLRWRLEVVDHDVSATGKHRKGGQNESDGQGVSGEAERKDKQAHKLFGSRSTGSFKYRLTQYRWR